MKVVLYILTERQKGQKGMDDYGGDNPSNGRFGW